MMYTETIKTLPKTPGAELGVKLYLGSAFAVLLLMMVAGLAMRAAQAQWIELPANFFYQVMTVHGAGMIGIAALAGAGIMWYFLSRYVVLRTEILYLNFALFLLGVVSILGAIFLGGYAGGWTFLWPLPAKSMGIWSNHAAAAFIVGLILIGVGFLAFYFDAAIAISKKYGSVLKGLGLDQLFSGQIDAAHPPTIVASCMVIIVNTIGTLTGAVVLVVTLANLYFPEVSINPLLAKNLIYFFGHVFINASIYMAVIAVYEILPVLTHRPWKVSRTFYAAWACATIFVMTVYPHHLLMDAVMPNWMLAMGQVVSYLSGMPVLLVTAYGALLMIYRSEIRWTAAGRWLIFSMFGWSVGVIPAIVDGTIQINKVMHNTLWVPGHFHYYLLGGLLPMVIGFSLHVTSPTTKLSDIAEKIVFWVYAVAVTVFSAAFLLGGWAGAPRRWASHYEQWLAFDKLGASAAVVVVVVTLAAAVTIFKGLLNTPKLQIHAQEG